MGQSASLTTPAWRRFPATVTAAGGSSSEATVSQTTRRRALSSGIPLDRAVPAPASLTAQSERDTEQHERVIEEMLRHATGGAVHMLPARVARCDAYTDFPLSADSCNPQNFYRISEYARVELDPRVYSVSRQHLYLPSEVVPAGFPRAPTSRTETVVVRALATPAVFTVTRWWRTRLYLVARVLLLALIAFFLLLLNAYAPRNY